MEQMKMAEPHRTGFEKGYTFEQKFKDAKGNTYCWVVEVLDEIGRGNSCIAYDVNVTIEENVVQRMVMKQFYPALKENEITASLNGTELVIDGYEYREDIKELGELFEKAYELQNSLANEKMETMQVVVKPRNKYFSGATKLVFYEANFGESFDKFEKEHPNELSEMLKFMKETAEALGYVHNVGYIHMDLKPKNILWVNHKQVKFFDFDALVEKDKKRLLGSIRCDEQLLAPELRKTRCLGTHLLDRVDIYSLGCMLFHYVMKTYPTDEQCRKPEIFKGEFLDKVKDMSGEALSEVQQKELYRIVGKSIQYDAERRYQAASELSEDLCGLEKMGKKSRRNPVDYMMLSAYVLDNNPLYKYGYMSGDSQIIDVAIIGSAEIRTAFMKNIFACVQMLDTTINIRMMSEDAEIYLEKLLEECPQLRDTAYFYLNDRRYIDKELNQVITRKPLANFYFYNAAVDEENVLKYLPIEDICYYLVVEKDDTVNHNIAQMLVEKSNGAEHENSFIGYGKKNRHTENRDIAPFAGNVEVYAFLYDANIGDKLFKSNIFKLALGVHTFYTKDWKETATAKWIRDDFESWDGNNVQYNKNSSVRCALSIKYKYASCGIPLNVDMPKVFYERVLADNEEAKDMLYKMAYLEHVSWMCFMIMNGYRLPSDAEMEEYLYAREGNQRNDHRNKKEKLHPCICASSCSREKTLEGLEHSKWKNSSERNNKKYDELDRMSLKLHAICEKKIADPAFGKRMEILFGQLSDITLEKLKSDDVIAMQEQVYDAYKRMVGAESNINNLWNKLCEEFDRMLGSLEQEECRRILKDIRENMKVVEARNLYHDYKKSDITIIKAIPRLMMKEVKGEYRRIYKTPSVRMGDILISTIIMEPKELVLLEDGSTDFKEQKKILERFLEKRGLEEIEIKCTTVDKIVMKSNAVKSLLDITGSSINMMMELSRRGLLEKMPVAKCENGVIIPENQYADDVRYYNQERHLTVEDTFTLYNARIFTENKENYMLRLNNLYQDLWKSYIDIGNTRFWREIVEFFKGEESKNYWRLPLVGGRMQTYSFDDVARTDMENSQVDKVLKQLKYRGHIKEYSIPDDTETGQIAVECSEAVKKVIGDMLTRIKNGGSAHHKYSFLPDCYRDPVNEDYLNGMWDYIYDAALSVDVSMEDKEIIYADGKKRILKRELYAKVLECICSNGRKEVKQNGLTTVQQRILQRVDGEELVSKTQDGKFKVKFRFANCAIKECLLKEGNILELYAYHTLLQKGSFDDVRANVKFCWNSLEDGEHLKNGSVTNEIDLVCTKGIQTYFISCKQAELKKEFLTEIKYYADYFGINAKAIILCSHWKMSDGSNDFGKSYLLNRSKCMDVYIINRDCIGKDEQSIRTGKLAKTIRDIVDGKEETGFRS